MKHTPRPWSKTKSKKPRLNEDNYLIYTTKDGRHIAEVFEQQLGSGEAGSLIDPTPNAQLIIAAPELLEDGYTLAMLALQSKRYQAQPDFQKAVDNMLLIIKQAKGE